MAAVGAAGGGRTCGLRCCCACCCCCACAAAVWWWQRRRRLLWAAVADVVGGDRAWGWRCCCTCWCCYAWCCCCAAAATVAVPMLPSTHTPSPLHYYHLHKQQQPPYLHSTDTCIHTPTLPSTLTPSTQTTTYPVMVYSTTLLRLGANTAPRAIDQILLDCIHNR